MAEFRQIHTRIWKDDWFTSLEPDAKLLFVYLFSNEQAEVGGVYELPVKYMSFESGLPQARIIELLEQFEVDKKVFYRAGWVWVVNLRKYNETGSSSVFKRIEKDLASLPDGDLKKMYCQYHQIPYKPNKSSIDTLSTPSPQGIDTRFKLQSETETETETETEKSVAYTPTSLFIEVTGWMSIPSGEIEKAIPQLETIIRNKPKPVEYLLPFWERFKELYSRTTRTFWLDWAIADILPPAKNGKVSAEDNPLGLEPAPQFD